MGTSAVKLDVARLVKRARRLADAPQRSAAVLAWHRVAFFAHATLWTGVLLLLLATAGFKPALVVALAWGILLSTHGFLAVLAPRLGRRWTQQELALNAMTEKADAGARQLVQARQARSLEQLSASIAHEIRNPITAAKSLVQQIAEDPSSPDNVEYARVALEELDRVERSIVAPAALRARGGARRRSSIDLAERRVARSTGCRPRSSPTAAHAMERDFESRGAAAAARRRGQAAASGREPDRQRARRARRRARRADPCVRVVARAQPRRQRGVDARARQRPGHRARARSRKMSRIRSTPRRRAAPGSASRSRASSSRRTAAPSSVRLRRQARAAQFVAPRCPAAVPAVKPRILVVEDESAIRVALRGLLAKEGYEVEIASLPARKRSSCSRTRASTSC